MLLMGMEQQIQIVGNEVGMWRAEEAEDKSWKDDHLSTR